jgi:cobalt-zinc-cadmium efflux system membrane fusion protein
VKPVPVAVLVLASLLAAACGPQAPPPKAAPAPVADPMQVQASPELLARLVIAKVVERELVETFRVSGSVQVDEQRIARIGSTVTGRIVDAPVLLGAEVRAGQALARLDSTELATAQRDYLKADLDMQLALRGLERAKILLAADVISIAELQRRETELLTAEAVYKAARGNMLVLGMSAEAIEHLDRSRAINPSITLRSKLTGTVIDRRVMPGQVVVPADILYIVADLSQVWVVGEVPEHQIAGIRVGESVQVELPALGNRLLTGRITFVGGVVNPETRTVTVRSVLPNADRSLRPAMLVSLLIKDTPKRLPAVPAVAVVRDRGIDHVFVQTEPSAFQLRPVELGLEIDGWRPVLKGLRAGDLIVADGSFLLNTERLRAR